MKVLTGIVLGSVTALALMGCNSSNDKESMALKVGERNASILVDTDGMSLYTFDKDMLNKSNCDAQCQEKWPFFRGADSGSADIKVIEGTDHLSYRGHPLYYFFKDKAPGDILGNNIKGVWDLVYAPAGSTDSQTALSDIPVKESFLTDGNGMALYTFDKDDENESKCTGKEDAKPLGSCEARWPVFYAADLGVLPAGTTASDFGTIDRPSDTLVGEDGKPLATKQTTYKGQPLYYWFKDQKSGDVSGNWVGGVWHLVDLYPER